MVVIITTLLLNVCQDLCHLLGLCIQLGIFLTFFFLHVYVMWSVCMCAFMFIYLCAHKCDFLYIKARGWWFLQLISALFTNTRTLSEPRASLTSKSAIGTLCFCLPSLGIQIFTLLWQQPYESIHSISPMHVLYNLILVHYRKFI